MTENPWTPTQIQLNLDGCPLVSGQGYDAALQEFGLSNNGMTHFGADLQPGQPLIPSNIGSVSLRPLEVQDGDQITTIAMNGFPEMRAVRGNAFLGGIQTYLSGGMWEDITFGPLKPSTQSQANIAAWNASAGPYYAIAFGFVSPSQRAKLLADSAKKPLSEAIQKAIIEKGYHPHDLKDNSKQDLFKDRDGNIYVKPRSGVGPGEPAGININEI